MLLLWSNILAKVIFRISQIYNYLFGFMKCRIIFSGLEFEKSLRNREKYGLHTKLDLLFNNCR